MLHEIEKLYKVRKTITKLYKKLYQARINDVKISNKVRKRMKAFRINTMEKNGIVVVMTDDECLRITHNKDKDKLVSWMGDNL